ncbi:GntR family transcriptional regulator [Rhizobium sp. CG5]|uniref:GntR family transcriptional regulator n=1 Tax=Rhizobium sp. CG5 TaxID=2726076 RepID=UPI00203376C8|nr:GntR family transcriptional regulator [Rhizobium sp. CG5]MCM2477742.1 GntR family transcriptional regulator [Rhizobium sp. CG5]
MSDEHTKRGDRAQQIQRLIRDAIITGELAPGSALRQEELAKTYASSRMPIREALRLLSAEGLVQLIPNRGGIVAPIDLNDIRENFEMREVSETLAIRLALPHLSNSQIDRAAEIQNQIENCAIEDFGRLNKAFHLTLYEPSNRPRLIAHIGSLHDIADRYLRFTLQQLNYFDRSSADHKAIVEACYKRDQDGAVKLTSSHIFDAGKTLESYLRNM